MVTENLKEVNERIALACERSGRKKENVTLIAVSKTKPVEMMREAMKCGIRVFGENKVQEIVSKQEILTDDLDWHMIGHLQRNKVRMLPGRIKRIHSVDSLRLAAEIDKRFGEADETAHILAEVNVAKEKSKFGLLPDEVYDFMLEVSKMPHIRVHGLMTIAPYVDDPERNRPIFNKLKKICVDINAKNIDNISMDELSMGMTNDYEVAIEEGATYVRVGTGIFGSRIYT